MKFIAAAAQGGYYMDENEKLKYEVARELG